MMLERNILADTYFYPSYAHTIKNIDHYLHHINIVFKEINNAVVTQNVHNLIITHQSHQSYSQLC